MISEAVLTPGITGRSSFWQRRTTSALRPGETTNRAPDSYAWSTCLGRAECGLGDRQPAGDQGGAQVGGTFRIVQDDDRNHPVAAQDIGEAHRSSAMTVLSSV
jgi:hypothetical protein